MLLLTNGTVLTMGKKGVFENGYVLINDQGKIASVGNMQDVLKSENVLCVDKNSISESACDIVDLKGKYILPGLIDAHSHIGITSVTNAAEDNANELSRPITAELNSYYGISYEDPIFQQVLSSGVTTSCIVPGSGNLIGGWGIVLKSTGNSRRKRILKNPAVLKAALGLNPKSTYAAKNMAPMTRMSMAYLLKDYLYRVKKYKEQKEMALKNGTDLPEYDEAMEHGIPVLEKKIPLKVHVYQQDMMFLLEIAKKFDINVTMDHAQGASDFIEELRDSHVKGIIFGPIVMGLGPGEVCKADYEALPMLDEAGIKVAVMTDGPVVTGDVLIHQIGEAVRMGMDPLRAIGMITCNPADILGCEDRIGRLEPGLDADISVFSHYPGLNVQAQNVMTILDGKIVFSRLQQEECESGKTKAEAGIC